jgi:hypothetical protein
MAIVFDCPHCKTNYRLKDEFAGKTATCKNPGCRKVITIPKPTAATATPKKIDVEALAAAAFSDESAPTATAVEELIQVTCSGCDHIWSVEASKEGKNVLCPECRRPNRVPMRKKEEKADWRTGGAGPQGRRVETGEDKGVWTGQAGSIGQETARAIVKERDSQEEPGVRRKRWIKRGIYGFIAAGVLTGGIYYLVKSKREDRADSTMEAAVAEVKEAKADARYLALIHRASGEYRARDAKKDEAKAALNELKLARNGIKLNPTTGTMTSDQNAILAEIAITMTELAGSAEQVDAGERLKKDEVVKEIRQTLSTMTDPEAVADAMRAITRKLAKDHSASAQEIARQLSNEVLGQVGLELLRMDREKNGSEAEKVLSSVPAGATAEAASIKSLRNILKPGGKKDKETGTSPEAAALMGNTADAKRAADGLKTPQERVKALATVAHAVSESNPTEAANIGEMASGVLKSDPKMPISPFVTVKLCRLLAKAGRGDSAESLAASMPDKEAQSWARLEILRGKLAQGTQKGESELLTAMGDPTKVPAAAKAHEDLARHNAAHGHDYSAIIKTWPKGTVKPFGDAGLLLGKQDEKLKK